MVAVDFDHWPYPRRCAHRGAGKLAPENTLAAMRLGASFGYRMFEFDVKLTGDGALILMHDPTLERTTDARGRVAAMSLAQCARLDAGSWHSPAYAGEGVPTLARLATWLRAGEHAANIEIKPCPGRERETGAAVALEARGLWREAAVPPLLSSFSEAALAAAAEVAPELPRALLFGALPQDWIARARALGCVAIDPDHRRIGAPVVAQARAARLRVVTYTVNDVQRAAELAAWGVDTVITDWVDRIAP